MGFSFPLTMWMQPIVRLDVQEDGAIVYAGKAPKHKRQMLGGLWSWTGSQVPVQWHGAELSHTVARSRQGQPKVAKTKANEVLKRCEVINVEPRVQQRECFISPLQELGRDGLALNTCKCLSYQSPSSGKEWGRHLQCHRTCSQELELPKLQCWFSTPEMIAELSGSILAIKFLALLMDDKGSSSSES